MESSSSSSSSGSSKRKALGNIAHCLVDGCSADLSVCRDYHRRHKVCEAHSKTPKVTIGGREQRFCQQCSRFHSLVEFDEGKRSCRKRLDGHNRRRRKPQPDVSTQHNISKLVSFNAPPNLPLFGSSSYSWSGPQHELGMLCNNHQLNYVDTGSVFPKWSPYKEVGSTFLDPNGSSGSGSCNSRMLSQVVEHDGALSLLSSPRVDYGGGGGVQSPSPSPTTASTFQMFHHAPEGSSSHQTLSFMWE